MTVKMWSIYKAGGFIVTVYTFARSLGALKASILGQIISEFNHAHNNGLTFYDDFLFNPRRMSQYLGLSEDMLIQELHELEDLYFIEVYDSEIADTMYIRVNQQEIINFKNKVETENMYGKWDDGLLRSQNPLHKQTHFCNSVEQIKNYLDEHMREPEKIPLVLYSYASSVIENFEEKTGHSILCNPNLIKSLNMIVTSDAPRELFEIFISKINISED